MDAEDEISRIEAALEDIRISLPFRRDRTLGPALLALAGRATGRGGAEVEEATRARLGAALDWYARSPKGRSAAIRVRLEGDALVFEEGRRLRIAPNVLAGILVLACTVLAAGWSVVEVMAPPVEQSSD